MFPIALLMWWQAKLIRSVTLFCCVMPLIVSCGFSPVYKNTVATQNVEHRLSQIDVLPINQGRMGQELRYLLIDKLGSQGKPAYQLSIDLRKQQNILTIEPDSRASRYNVILIAHYRIKDLRTGQRVAKGVSKATGSYDRVDSEFATFVAGSKTVKLITKELAEVMLNDIVMKMMALYENPA